MNWNRSGMTPGNRPWRLAALIVANGLIWGLAQLGVALVLRGAEFGGDLVTGLAATAALSIVVLTALVFGGKPDDTGRTGACR